jgi:hypothetical protein
MPEMNRKTAASAMPASAPWGNTFDLFAIVKQIVGAKAQFGSLADAWADTATSRRLMIAVFGGAAFAVAIKCCNPVRGGSAPRLPS